MTASPRRRRHDDFATKGLATTASPQRPGHDGLASTARAHALLAEGDYHCLLVHTLCSRWVSTTACLRALLAVGDYRRLLTHTLCPGLPESERLNAKAAYSSQG